MPYQFSYDISKFDDRAKISIYAYGNGCTIDISVTKADEILEHGDTVVLDAFGDIIEAYYQESQ